MFRTILFFFFFWLTFIPAFPISILVLILRLFGLGRLVRGPVQTLAWAWGRLVLAMLSVKLVLEGVEKIPRTGGACFVGNHQGDLDIVLALACINRPFGFISKKEVVFFPFVGLWLILLDGLFLDRKSARKALDAIKKGAERIKKGSAMLIFPEGHRSRGPVMGEFRPGAFKLATMGDAVIVPMTIDGSYRCWEEHKRLRPCTVRVVFHDPIATEGLDAEARKALPELVKASIGQALPGEGK